MSCRTTAVLSIVILLGSSHQPAGLAARQAAPPPVRLALVNVPDDVLRPLLPLFAKETGRTADIVYTGRDPFNVGRSGKADVVIAHYGHESVEEFVTGGFGLWPKPVFANSIAILGPASDPAKVRDVGDPVEAFRRIRAADAPFVVNNSPGVKYVENILAALSGGHRSWERYSDSRVEGPDAARAAAQMKAYVLWGLPPFLRFRRQGEMRELEALVVGPALFQRMMVSVVVNPAKVPTANAEGGRAFEQFLLAPATQAAIEAFRYPDFPRQAWFAAGRHNSARD